MEVRGQGFLCQPAKASEVFLPGPVLTSTHSVSQGRSRAHVLPPCWGLCPLPLLPLTWLLSAMKLGPGLGKGSGKPCP